MINILIGLIIGLVAGLIIYSKIIDKPEKVYNGNVKIKQKRGLFRNFLKKE